MLTWKLLPAGDDPALAEGRAPEGLLSTAEAEVLEGFRFEARRRKWLLGRAAAKALLIEVLGSGTKMAPEPATVVVKNEDSGAPFAELEGRRLPGCLTISHRTGFGAAAYEDDPAIGIGIDLELVETRSPALLRTFFTEAEQVEVAAQDDHTAQVSVARIWSAKEAVLKALRLGLRRDTRQIEIALPDPEQALLPVAPGFAPLQTRLLGEIQPEVEGELRLGWRNEGAYVLTLALLVPD